MVSVVELQIPVLLEIHQDILLDHVDDLRHGHVFDQELDQMQHVILLIQHVSMVPVMLHLPHIPLQLLLVLLVLQQLSVVLDHGHGDVIVQTDELIQHQMRVLPIRS